MALRYLKSQTKIGFGKEKKEKFVGRRRLADSLSLERLAKEIAQYTGQAAAQCEITLRYMACAIEDAMLDGRSVDIGIGTTSPAINTKSADTADGVKVVKKRALYRANASMRRVMEQVSVKLITEQDDGTSDTAPDDHKETKPNGGGTHEGAGGGLGA